MKISLWRIKRKIKETSQIYGGPIGFMGHLLHNVLSFIKDRNVAYVYADRSNVGDYISYLGVRELFGNAKGYCLLASPGALGETTAWLKLLSCRKNPPLLLVGGGGLFQEVFEPFWEVLLDSSLPFGVIGAGMCFLEGKRSSLKRDLCGAIAKKAFLLHVRDETTRKAFVTVGAKWISVGPCPSVHYLRAFHKRSILHNKGVPVLLNAIHNYDLRECGVDVREYKDTLAKICRKRGLVYREENNISKSHEDILKTYLKADIVISSRLHGCIISATFGKYTLPIVCDQKIKWYLESNHPSLPLIFPEQLYRKETIEGLIDKAVSSISKGKDL